MRRFLISICLVFLLATPALAVETSDRAEDKEEQDVTVTVPQSYVEKRIVLFPLMVPAYVFRAVTWPLGAIVESMERTHAISRIADFLSNKEKTMWVYPMIEGGAGSGFGGGLGFRATDLFHEGYEAHAHYKIHIDLNQYAGAWFRKADAFSLFGRPVTYEARANWAKESDADFYGVGAETSQADHSKYAYNDLVGDFDVLCEVVRNLSVSLLVGARGSNSGSSDADGYPSVTTTFQPSELDGFGKWFGYFVAGLGLEHDTRDNWSMPTRGGLRSLYFKRYQNVGSGSFDYNEYELDITQYIPLWRPGLVFVIHNGWLFQQETGANKVPFYRLATLDAGNDLRGFDRGRFTDKAKVIFNFEYLFPIWRMIEGIVLCDTGRVFHGLPEFSFDDFRYSAGGGFNIHLFRITLFQFRAAYGGEGVKIFFGVKKTI